MDPVIVNADLHVHGLYSGGVSKNMLPNVIAEQAPLKGLQLIATGDILHGKWLNLMLENLKVLENGLLEHANGTKFILQTEVEDSKRAHHIILFPCLDKVHELREEFSKYTTSLDTDGRPKINLSAEEIAEICNKAECLIGPSHAFTPWTAIFKEYNSLKECYGNQTNKVYFLELGLSADTNMADRISELHHVTFISNSDSHSPWPDKMGREFNRFQLQDLDFDCIAKALKGNQNNKIVLNAGFNPLEGKYHKTRCMGCLLFFSLEQARMFNWRCPNCGKPIKKGVADRIEELADLPSGNHPEFRPKYLHIIPLSEIIALALDLNAHAVKVQTLWQKFVSEFGNEITVLVEKDISELEKLNKEVAKYIGYFRQDKISYLPGGAGVYGKLLKPGEKVEIEKYLFRQKSLAEF